MFKWPSATRVTVVVYGQISYSQCRWMLFSF